jgi:hypothetical protein
MQIKGLIKSTAQRQCALCCISYIWQNDLMLHEMVLVDDPPRQKLIAIVFFNGCILLSESIQVQEARIFYK